MDRYHLAWLMVGKPKGIVRGREMTGRRGGGLRPRGRGPEDRGAADEPRRRGAPGDAVPRRDRRRRRRAGDGRGPGRRRSRRRRRRRGRRARARSPRPRAGRSRSTRTCSAGSTRPGGRPPSTTPTSRAPGRRHATPGSSGDARPASRPSAASATSRRPTTSRATTSCSASGSTSTCPGPSTATSGPAELKARVDMEPLRPPAAPGRRRASRCVRGSAPRSPEPDRRHWLDLQLVALETLARVAAGEPIPYLDQVERCLTLRPERRADATVRAGRARRSTRCSAGSRQPRRPARGRGRRLDRAARTRPGRRRGCSSPRYRERARRRLYALPEGEALRVSLVRGQPWSGYNWYDGGYRSRVDLNLDLPIRLPTLVGTVAHETYPGHHLEHATKERVLVEELGPPRVVDPADQHPRVPAVRGPGQRRRRHRGPARRRCPTCSSSWRRSPGCRWPTIPTALRDAVARQAAIADAAGDRSARRGSTPRSCSTSTARRASRSSTTWSRSAGRSPATRGQAARVHRRTRCGACTTTSTPRARRCSGRWLDAVPPAERDARFGRLLREPLTPPAIRAETAAALAEPGSSPSSRSTGRQPTDSAASGRARDGCPVRIRLVTVAAADRRSRSRSSSLVARAPVLLERVEVTRRRRPRGRRRTPRCRPGTSLSMHSASPKVELVDRGIVLAAGVVADDEDLAVVGLGARQVLDVLISVADRAPGSSRRPAARRRSSPADPAGRSRPPRARRPRGRITMIARTLLDIVAVQWARSQATARRDDDVEVGDRARTARRGRRSGPSRRPRRATRPTAARTRRRSTPAARPADHQPRRPPAPAAGDAAPRSARRRSPSR